jgi:4-diphosphocytidyl-2-C-methyl-D-erythritol kinase
VCIVKKTTIFSPAKINLFLAITGRRPDGFHDLVSVVAPISFGDWIGIELLDTGGPFEMTCTDASVPVDGSNLILKAAEAFRAASGWQGTARFHLDKRTPVGAGLGGGSSNAAWVLRVLNDEAGTAGHSLDETRLAELAAAIGSDCALFLAGAPVVMRGRGERVERLPAGAARRLRGRRLLIFKPNVSVSTAWAYRWLAAHAPGSYLPATEAEARMAAWIDGTADVENLLFNNMEPPAFGKYVALPVLLKQLRERFGVAAAMSGSGSACFALLREGAGGATDTEIVREMEAFVRNAWGRDAFVTEAGIL